MTNKFDTQGNDYKVPAGRNFGNSFFRGVMKNEYQFSRDFFAKQEKIMTKHKALTNRRNFLIYSTLSAASLFIVNACKNIRVKKWLPFPSDPNRLRPFQKQFIASCCSACQQACPLLVKTIENRPVKIEGNPEFPLTAGGTCASGQVAVPELYRNDRIKTPLINNTPVSDTTAFAFLKDLIEKRDKKQNAWFISSVSNSPSETNLILDFCKQSGFKPLFYQKFSHSAWLDANGKSFGKRVLSTYKFNKTKVVLSFHDDFLSTGIAPVQHTAQFSRSVEKDFKLIQFESLLTATGIKAYKRIKTSVADTAPLMLALYNILVQNSANARFDFVEKKYEDAIRPYARMLMQNQGRCLVLCGINDLDFQMLTNTINVLLGNIGRTLDLDNTAFTNESPGSIFSEFFTDLRNSNIDTAFIYNANPLVDFGSDFYFKKIKNTVGFFTFSNETLRHCQTVIPVSHFLESYFDHEHSAGYFCLSQPVVKPLFGTRQLADHLLAFENNKNSFHTYLKSRWKKKFLSDSGNTNFELFWKNATQKGFGRLPLKRVKFYLPSVEMEYIAGPVSQKFNNGKKIAVLFQNSHLKASYYPAHPYLKELPNGVASFSWRAVATVSPAFAQKNGYDNGDEIVIKTKQGKITLPVLVIEGQADRDIGIASGYEDSPNLFRIDKNGLLPFVEFEGTEKTGNKPDLPFLLPGNAEIDFNKAIERSNIRPVDRSILFNKKRVFFPHHWAMAIDLKKCTACKNCVVSCQLENNIPVVGKKNALLHREMHWLKFHYFKTPEGYGFIPVNCQHCDQAPCEPVCPVGATSSSSEGINQQSYQRCIGARFCGANCPYETRRFNYDHYFENISENKMMTSPAGRMALNPEVAVRERGMMEKCSFCIQRIQDAKYLAKKEDRELKDGDIQTACQQSCPAKAIVFGDLNDPVSSVSLKLQQKNSFRLFGSLGTEPSVFYFPDITKQTDTV